MTEQLDALLFAAFERWWDTNRSAMAAHGVTASLQGPFDAPGMDPVYILSMDSDRRETEVVLFRGGTFLSTVLNKRADAEIEGSSVEVSSEGELADLLARFAERA